MFFFKQFIPNVEVRKEDYHVWKISGRYKNNSRFLIYVLKIAQSSSFSVMGTQNWRLGKNKCFLQK